MLRAMVERIRRRVLTQHQRTMTIVVEMKRLLRTAVEFARLSGGHLTPGDAAGGHRAQQRDVEDVADTVASYIRSLKA